MRKWICVMMIAALAVLMLAGCGGEKETTIPTTAAVEEGPGSALEILETVWGLYGEDEKFPSTGGEMGDTITEGPGGFSALDETITYALLIPADQLTNVTEAASLMHMMNSNTFTCGAYRLAEGVTAESFAGTMKDAIRNNQWMCGFPDSLLIQQVGESFVVVAFGHDEIMDVFKTHLVEGYPDSQTLVEEPIV